MGNEPLSGYNKIVKKICDELSQLSENVFPFVAPIHKITLGCMAKYTHHLVTSEIAGFTFLVSEKIKDAL